MQNKDENKSIRKFIVINNLLFVFTAIFPAAIFYYFLSDYKSDFILYVFVIPGFIYMTSLILWNIYKILKKRK